MADIRSSDLSTLPVPAFGLTPNECGKLLRVSPDKVRMWIAKGELPAVNTATRAGQKPRWVILPHHLATWERRRLSQPPVKASRRRKRNVVPGFIDFYPDTEVAMALPEAVAHRLPQRRSPDVSEAIEDHAQGVESD